MKKRPSKNLTNSKARYDYDLEDSYSAGIVLSGAEVKSIRSSHVSLKGAFVTVKDGEAWLNNMLVTPISTNAANMPSEVQTRNRKLLLKASELEQIQAAKNSGRTVVPTRIIIGRYIKVQVAVAKGKKKYDKRQTLKRKTQNREAARAMSRRVKK